MKYKELRKIIREELENLHNEDPYDRIDPVLTYLEKELDLGNLQKFDIDDDEIYAAASRLGIKLTDPEVKEIFYLIEE